MKQKQCDVGESVVPEMGVLIQGYQVRPPGYHVVFEKAIRIQNQGGTPGATVCFTSQVSFAWVIQSFDGGALMV